MVSKCKPHIFSRPRGILFDCPWHDLSRRRYSRKRGWCYKRNVDRLRFRDWQDCTLSCMVLQMKRSLNTMSQKHILSNNYRTFGSPYRYSATVETLKCFCTHISEQCCKTVRLLGRKTWSQWRCTPWERSRSGRTECEWQSVLFLEWRSRPVADSQSWTNASIHRYLESLAPVGTVLQIWVNDSDVTTWRHSKSRFM